MRDTLPFLVRLGLRHDADAKDIRRAYARELKKIDQSADPAGFQELREAYEIALQWHAHQQFSVKAPDEPDAKPDGIAVAEPIAELTPAAPVAEPAAPPEPAADAPYVLANEAFERFTASTDMLVKGKDARHQSLWKTVLQRSLDDDRLLNLSARTIFEARIVHLLASGWRPGHETLFVVASDVFDWVSDSRRLAQFGEAGAMVNRAIDEWKLYESLSPHAIGTFKQLIQYVRATPQPQGVAGRNDLMLFHQLAGRFYTWLAVIIDREVLESWSKAAHAEAQRPGSSPPDQVAEQPMMAQPEERKSSSWSFEGMGFLKVLLFIALMRGCVSLMEDFNKPKGFYPPVSNVEQHAPPHAGRTVPLRAGPDKAPSQERVDEIRSRIDFKWPANTAPGAYVAVYDVFIDADGAVLGMNKVSSSGNTGYDEAVRKAIRETKPFPPGTKTRFTLRYSVTFNKPAAPKGTPPTQEQLRAVQDQIFYVPGSLIKSGELRVSYQLELDDKGRVFKLKKLKASRDPMYDEVVADALKATDAFPPGTQRKFSVEYYRTLGER